MSRYLTVLTLAVIGVVSMQAQTYQRRATTVGGGSPGQGRCVVEVVVDGAAQVEIRGDNASLRNLNGQPPQWRRFECTATMPVNPMNFHFAGIDGRGKQQLIQAPQNGGPAAIRIDDPDNGSEGYTFEITWGAPMEARQMPMAPPNAAPQPGRYPEEGPAPDFRGNGNNGNNGNYNNGNGNYNNGNSNYNNGNRGQVTGSRIFTEDAVQACQDYVRQQAARRYGAVEVHFRRTEMDNNPGRNDWVTGFFEGRTRSGRQQNYKFSCSVDFDSGQVRSANMQAVANGQTQFGNAANGRMIQACEASVEQRLARDGYQRVDFGSVSFDDRPGRNDWITGVATALERNRATYFDFSCQADTRDGTVRSAEVNRR